MPPRQKTSSWANAAGSTVGDGPPRIVLVTDPGYSDDAVLAAIENAASTLPRGALAVQLRDKARPLVELRVFASRLRLTTRQVGAMLLINGNAQLARDIGADGVHLGGGAMSITAARALCGPGAWISIAAHSDEAVRAAAKEGANAALVSPIFPTDKPAARGQSKSDKSETRVRVKDESLESKKRPRGIEALTSARAIVGNALFLYALGGVTPALTRRCMQAGADGVAVIRALLAASSPADEARAFLAAMEP
jgi:thiamine-phosphate pyrophosphorylase